MTPKSLDQLPEEILTRIASSGPADSVFALTRTCRTLYRTCYDTFVFKSIVESRRLLWDCSSMPNVATLSRHIDSQDTLTWARFAVADQRARKPHGLIGPEAVYDCGFRQGPERWLPHLIVAGYPITQMPYGDHSRSHSSFGDGLVISVKHRFCLAAALLNIPSCDLHSDQVSFYWTKPVHRAIQEKSLSDSINTLGAFALLLRRHLTSGLSKTVARAGVLMVTLPMIPPPAHAIPMTPLDSTYHLPVPLQPTHDAGPGTVEEEDLWTTWLHRHVAKMSEPEFFASGDWCGYYDHTGRSFLDPPMVAIQFAVSRRLNTVSATRRVRGNGHDGVGRFTLEGHLSSDGRLNLLQTYIGSHSWNWTCFMTPFGIFGGWGREEEQGKKLGSLWLWKQEWGTVGETLEEVEA